MSIRMVLQRITPEQYERLIVGDESVKDWDPEGEDESLDKSWEVLPAPGLGALSAELVREVAQDLVAITDEEIAHRATYMPCLSKYGGIMPPNDIPHYVVSMQCLRDFYAEAAQANAAVALWVG